VRIDRSQLGEVALPAHVASVATTPSSGTSSEHACVTAVSSAVGLSWAAVSGAAESTGGVAVSCSA
jgi:hypothetical protein